MEISVRKEATMTSNMPAIRLMTWNINKLIGQIQRGPRSSAAEIGVKRVIGDFLAQDDSPAIIVLQEGCGADCDPSGKFIEWLGSLDGCSVFAGSENRYIRTVVLSRGVHAELAECNKDLSRANRYVALNIDMGDKILHLLALHANANKDNGEIADDDIAARLCECGTWADDVALVLVGDANAAPKYRERLKREWGLTDPFAGKVTMPRYGSSPDVIMGRGMNIENAAVVKSSCSDHRLLTCAVRL